uniref:Uncharacterized protein n=1 Tax=Rhizophora mucronata TaxID=61149 RepID=A0A2P2QXE8_RHIMU
MHAKCSYVLLMLFCLNLRSIGLRDEEDFLIYRVDFGGNGQITDG